MEEMKLWAELTMSLQKVETKSNMEKDGTFSSRLCRGAEALCHHHPFITHHNANIPSQRCGLAA